MSESNTPQITYILLVRHGENDWVGENKLAGRTPDVHLNERGIKQAEEVASSLAQQEVHAVYSSPMERCLETAAVTADHFGLDVQEMPGVIEVDYGEWQGGSLKELSERPDWQLVQHAPSSFRFPGGETLYEVQARAIAAIDVIRQHHPNEVVAVFSHGDVIRTVIAHYIGVPFDMFQRVLIGTGSISAVVFHGTVPRVLFTNYVAALPKLEIPKEENENGHEPHNQNGA